MILLLDSSTPVCKLTLIDGDKRFYDEWNADRNLAKGLLGYLNANLKKHSKSWMDIAAIGVFEGPGSFTGLRIGLTVLNAIADSQHIPIIGAHGKDWQQSVLSRLDKGQDDKIVMPLYGSEAHITLPRK